MSFLRVREGADGGWRGRGREQHQANTQRSGEKVRLMENVGSDVDYNLQPAFFLSCVE